jgi:methyl-accepting chemotaxis protein
MTAERVLRSTSDHAQASGNVNRTVEVISGDFRAMAAEVRENVTDLQNIVTLSQEALNINDNNRRRAEELSSLIGDLNRFALYLGEDFRKLGGGETQTI